MLSTAQMWNSCVPCPQCFALLIAALWAQTKNSTCRKTFHVIQDSDCWEVSTDIHSVCLVCIQGREYLCGLSCTNPQGDVYALQPMGSDLHKNAVKQASTLTSLTIWNRESDFLPAALSQTQAMPQKCKPACCLWHFPKFNKFFSLVMLMGRLDIH